MKRPRNARKVEVQPTTIRIKVGPLLLAAVEHGVDYGWNRAHKWETRPGLLEIREAISDAVFSELCELLNFEDYP